jgi:hypothetical protein
MTLEKRMDAVSALGLAFVIGWVSNSGYYAVSDLWKQKAALVRQVRCEDARADKSALIAKQAILGAKTDGPIPSQRMIPKDCPHPVVSVPPVEHPSTQ